MLAEVLFPGVEALRGTEMKLSAAIFLLFVATHATAADWVRIGDSAIGTLDYDATTLKSHGQHVQVWFREHYAEPQPVPEGQPFDSTVVQAEIGCDDHTIKILEGTYFSAGKEVLPFGPQGSGPIEDGSIGLVIERAVCTPGLGTSDFRLERTPL
jgi:hypothetical protein